MSVAEKEVTSKAATLEKAAEKAAFTSNQKLTLTIKTDALKGALKKVAGSVATKTTVPALTGIYFRVSEAAVTLRGSNGRLLAESIILDQESFRLDGESGGAVFPGKLFIDLVNRLGGKTTTFEFDGLTATIKSKGAKLTLKGLHLNEFPAVPKFNEEMSFNIPSVVLAQMYKKTVYAASNEEIRPALTGLYHKISDKQLKIVATDSHRLSQQVAELDKEMKDASALIPKESISEVIKHIKDVDVVTVRFDKSYVLYELENTKLYALKLDVTYPDTDRIIPPGSTTEVIFQAGALRELLNRSTLYADNADDKVVYFLVQSENNQARITSGPTDYGQFQEDIRTTKGKGDNVISKVAVKYLTETLASIDPSEQLLFSFTGNVAPFVIRFVNSDPLNLDLVLPVRHNLEDSAVDFADFNPPEVDFDPFAEEAEEAAEQANESAGEADAK